MPKQSEYIFKNTSTSNLTFSQSSVSDWKEGDKSALDVKVGINDKLLLTIPYFKISTALRLNLGVQRESGEEMPAPVLKATDNESFGEFMIIMPVNWRIDPFVSVNYKTQVTESKRFIKDKPIRTANLWDPVISQQAAGFTYQYDGAPGFISSRIGLSLQQVRARWHTSQTDDPKTKGITEAYKADSGIEWLSEANLKTDSSAIAYTTRLGTRTLINNHLHWYSMWENEARFKVWKFIGVVLTVNLTHNPEQSKRVQFRQSLQIGVVQDF